jgi:cardiolipin synthase
MKVLLYEASSTYVSFHNEHSPGCRIFRRARIIDPMRQNEFQKKLRRLEVLLILVSISLSQSGCIFDRPIYYQIAPRYSVRDPQFAQTVGNLLGPPLLPGNTVQTLTNGDQIFPAMLAAIRSARKSITFETYIYWKGEIGQKFADALSERARAGVKTHVLIDWLGSDLIDPSYLKQMRQAGADIREYHAFHWYDPASWGNLDHRTHRKILVVDGTIGFTGGAGIADVWLGNADNADHWRDNHYRVEGPVVGQIQAAFCDNWMQTTGRVLAGDEYFPKIPSKGAQWGQMFRSSATGGSENMELLFLLSIEGAGQNIRMESAYFDPDSLTRHRLIEAKKRGVSIQIIVPGARIDQGIVRAASRAHWGEMLEKGIEIYEFQPTMIHCKQMIVDDYWVSIGSANMDNRSFRLNDEANLNVMDAEFAAEQIRLFKHDLTRCRKISYRLWQKRSFGEKIADAFSTLFDWEI